MSEDNDADSPTEPMEAGGGEAEEAKLPITQTVPMRSKGHAREVSKRLHESLAALGRRNLAEEIASGLGGRALKDLTGSRIGDVVRDIDRLGAFYNDGTISRIAGGYKNSVREVMKSLDTQRNAFSGAGFVAEQLQRVQDWAKPLGGLELVRSRLGPDVDTIGAIYRSHRWAGLIAGQRVGDVTSLLRKNTRVGDDIEKLMSAATGIFAIEKLHRDLVGSRIGDIVATGGALERTALKMSTFAGALDILGPRAGAADAAFDALLGQWRTRADLPPVFWREREARVDYYREADVDEGLVDADNAAVLEILVESGVVEGQARRGSVIALLEIGPVRMRISAGRARISAFRAIDIFEVTLRAFVATKLEAAVTASGQTDPKQWFKQRVPGDVIRRAKERRREAMKKGEAYVPLIAFTDLGDLIPIVIRRDNWTEAFESAFINADEFRIDVERLTASRRPTMHARTMDQVRLVELLCVIRRLDEMMRRDGAWDTGWDDDI